MFNNVNDFSTLEKDSSQVELNNLVNEKVRTGKTNESVEIFSKIVYGKDVSSYGKKVDDVMGRVKEMSSAAANGNLQAKAEINSINTIILQQPLVQRLQINNVLGNVTNVGFGEELRYTYYQTQAAELSRIQASSGSFVFPTVKKQTRTADRKTATGGVVFDWRELASGATDGLAYANEQVITDITNQVVLSNINALRTAIQSATTLKNYAAGITATNVENVRKKARRFSNTNTVTIMGDINAIDKLSDFAGFNINSTTNVNEVRFSQSVMDEIMRTGLLKNYKGSAVVEMPNAYNMTEFNTAGDFYKPYLPTTDLWFIPQGMLTPLQIVLCNGLTSMTANNINDATEVTRYDLCFGNAVINEYVPSLGYIYDSSLAE